MARQKFSDYISRLDPQFKSSEPEPGDATAEPLDAEHGRELALVSEAGTPVLKPTQVAASVAGLNPAGSIALEQITFPQRAERRSWFGIVSFFLIFVIPSCLVAAYYLHYASKVYETNFRFSVRNSSPGQGASALGNAMSIVGVSSNNDAVNYQIADYLTSRAAVDQLEDSIKVTDLYSRPSIDYLSRFKDLASREAFESYWKHVVGAKYDQVTGIVSVTVSAFRPQDTFLVANSLVKASEDLVNGLEQRTLNDGVANAKQEVQKAQEQLEKAHVELTQFRKSSGVIDPTSSLVTSNSSLVQTLEASLATLQTRYNLLASQKLDPKGVSMKSLSDQIAATKEQIRLSEASVATARDRTPQGANGTGATGGNGMDQAALSSVIAQYEKLNLSYQFAQTLVTGALATLEQAKVNAFTQHLYITPYVRPSLPTAPESRVLTITLTAAALFVLWFVIFIMTSDIRDRFGHGGH